MSIVTVGIGLAKNVFAVHGVDDNGEPVLVKPKLARADLVALIAQLPPCLIGMEACSGAHYWARLFRRHGHTVRLMAPKFVTPYRMDGKRGKARRSCGRSRAGGGLPFSTRIAANAASPERAWIGPRRPACRASAIP